jgi:hypothetical protein
MTVRIMEVIESGLTKASDRVPVNGISSIMFVIQKNGVGDLVSPLSITSIIRTVILIVLLASPYQLEGMCRQTMESDNLRTFYATPNPWAFSRALSSFCADVKFSHGANSIFLMKYSVFY